MRRVDRALAIRIGNHRIRPFEQNNTPGPFRGLARGIHFGIRRAFQRSPQSVSQQYPGKAAQTLRHAGLARSLRAAVLNKQSGWVVRKGRQRIRIQNRRSPALPRATGTNSRARFSSQPRAKAHSIQALILQGFLRPTTAPSTIRCNMIAVTCAATSSWAAGGTPIVTKPSPDTQCAPGSQPRCAGLAGTTRQDQGRDRERYL